MNPIPQPPDQRPSEPDHEQLERDADDDFWQWIALIVLLGCWLAEASF